MLHNKAFLKVAFASAAISALSNISFAWVGLRAKSLFHEVAMSDLHTIGMFTFVVGMCVPVLWAGRSMPVIAFAAAGAFSAGILTASTVDQIGHNYALEHGIYEQRRNTRSTPEACKGAPSSRPSFCYALK